LFGTRKQKNGLSEYKFVIVQQILVIPADLQTWHCWYSDVHRGEAKETRSGHPGHDSI